LRINIPDFVALIVLIVLVVEVEHLSDRTGDAVKTTLTDALPSKPVVFDESQRGRLVRDCVVDEVALGPRRNYDEGLAGAIATRAKRMKVSGFDAGHFPRYQIGSCSAPSV
jgi:hypothetical protein